jgi:hypothetical protein
MMRARFFYGLLTILRMVAGADLRRESDGRNAPVIGCCVTAMANTCGNRFFAALRMTDTVRALLTKRALVARDSSLRQPPFRMTEKKAALSRSGRRNYKTPLSEDE